MRTRQMFDADYSAIEARITCWVAGEHAALAEYHAQDAAITKDEKERLDRYRLMACDIYGIGIDDVTKFPHRFIGKQAILGCGFGAAAPKFRVMCKTMGGYDLPVGLEFTVVDKFRAKHKRIKACWYECDTAAKSAIVRKGEMFEAARCHFICKDVEGMTFLLIRLPSGRKLAYPRPRVQPSKKFPPPATEIVYFGQVGQTRNWGDVDTYGGKILENIVQAIETDILAIGAQNAEDAGIPVLMLLHDQALGEYGGQAESEFVGHLTNLPAWAEGLPIQAEGGLVDFYKKD